MTFVYTNANTGDVVELPQRDPCLDMLDNWSCMGPGDIAGAVPDDSATQFVLSRPPESATKAAWIAYAISRGMDEPDAKALSKAALIEEFGEDSDGED